MLAVITKLLYPTSYFENYFAAKENQDSLVSNAAAPCTLSAYQAMHTLHVCLLSFFCTHIVNLP